MDVPDAKPGQGENHLSLIIEQTINQKKRNRYLRCDGEVGVALVMMLLFPCVNPSAGTEHRTPYINSALMSRTPDPHYHFTSAIAGKKILELIEQREPGK